jgi:hypothetical protein
MTPLKTSPWFALQVSPNINKVIMMVLIKSERKLCRSAKDEFCATFIENPKISSHMQKPSKSSPPKKKNYFDT